MSACEASMSLLFYFSRGKQIFRCVLLFGKMSYKEKRQHQWSSVPNSEGTSCLARQCTSCEMI